jgi:hypothetical protein
MITFQLCDSDSVTEVALGGTLLHRQASAYQPLSRCMACTVLRQGARLWHQGQQCCLQPQIIKDCAVLHVTPVWTAVVHPMLLRIDTFF